MVSEPRRGSYAVAVSGTGEISKRPQPTTLADRSPVRTAPTINPQRQSTPQRSVITEDIENPLFLSSNENANVILVSLPLTGNPNYGTWSISMRVALEVKNKWSVVDGTISTLERSHPQYVAWRRCNLMICSWIFKFVHPYIAQSIMYMDKAKEV